jgi:SAM-dependent methyltransferase
LIQAIYPDAAKEAQDFAKWVKPNPGLAVVEVAAGTARLAENGLAAMLGPGSQYLITDASDLLLARAFRKCRRQWPWVHCLMAPMDDLPLASQCVDLVIAAFLFAPPKPGQVLKEMGRVVRPGGHIAISFRLRRELPDAWERVLRYVAPTEAVHRRQGEDLEQWQEQGEKMGLVVDGVRSDGGTFRFPSHEWAWAFLVGSGYWARVLRPHLASQGEMAIQRSANTVREALADIPLDQLTIPWALHYLRWTRPA